MLIERLQSDTDRSYAALVAYAAMGTQRSLEKVGQELGKSRVLMERWSSMHQWAIRIRAYDDGIAAEAEQQRAAIRYARRVELEDDDWNNGMALRSAVLSLLAEVPRFIRRSSSRVERISFADHSSSTKRLRVAMSSRS